MCPDMRESLRLDLVDADEAEEGRDRLLAAARTRATQAGSRREEWVSWIICVLILPSKRRT